jgi:hypothetical protein
MSARAQAKERAARGVLVLVALGLALAVVEVVGRTRFADTPYVPGPQIRMVQSELVLSARVGFLWRPHVEPGPDDVIAWSDAEPFALSTDSEGFLNIPEAIARVARGEVPDVVGVGDSFLQVADEEFYERFMDAGLLYYSLAMHHQGPPQYNRILMDRGIGLRPGRVLYGISENDYADTFDFERWEESGLDWFAFHSGSWCGPPSSGSPALDRARRGLRGTWAVWRALRANLWPDPPARVDPRVVRDYVLEARDAAQAAGIRFTVLIVPSKDSSLDGATPDAARHETLVGLLRESGVEIVDLRSSLAAAPGSPPLFHERDSHWNRAGQKVAAERILGSIRSRP